ncbi:hypothetical protein [Ferranicluibacter rubi]|nr:hypothetical protein [Ferranicluibacter rubi]
MTSDNRVFISYDDIVVTLAANSSAGMAHIVFAIDYLTNKDHGIILDV